MPGSIRCFNPSSSWNGWLSNRNPAHGARPEQFQSFFFVEWLAKMLRTPATKPSRLCFNPSSSWNGWLSPIPEEIRDTEELCFNPSSSWNGWLSFTAFYESFRTLLFQSFFFVEWLAKLPSPILASKKSLSFNPSSSWNGWLSREKIWTETERHAVSILLLRGMAG